MRAFLSTALSNERVAVVNPTELPAAALPLVAQDTFDQPIKSDSALDTLEKRIDSSSSSSSPDESASSASNYAQSSRTDDTARSTDLKAEAKLVDDSILPDDSSSIITSDGQVASHPRNRFASFPSVPASVHSFNSNRPPFMLDPTSGTLNRNPFPMPGQSPIGNVPSHTRIRYNPNQSYSPAIVNSMVTGEESIDRKDSPVSQGNMLTMAPIGNVNRIKDLAITPNIPPKPGTLGGPGFFSPPPSRGQQSSLPLAPRPNYNRIPINQLGAIWQNRPHMQQPQIEQPQHQPQLQQHQQSAPGQEPPRIFTPHQMITTGAHVPQVHPVQGSQIPIGSIHHTSKIYSSASASIPTHVDPPQVHKVIQQQQQHAPPSLVNVNVLPKSVKPTTAVIQSQANLPPKMYATANELTTKAPLVVASTTVLPVATVQSTMMHKNDSSEDKSNVLNMVMNAATAWNSLLNEVRAK